MNDAEMQQYLRENGYPEHVVKAGRKGLIERWNKFVDEVERGYGFGIEDYAKALPAAEGWMTPRQLTRP